MSLDVLTPFQVLVARTFFTISESRGFLLAGGAALVAQGLSDRPTQDLDFFTAPSVGDVGKAKEALLAEVAEHGWTCRVIRDHETFCRLVLIDSAGDEVLVDLAVDSAPGQPSTISLIGPTFALEELAGRKTIALFDRAEARDFVDVYGLVKRYGPDVLLNRAAEVDRGFSLDVFVQMLRTLDRFADEALPIESSAVMDLRAFFASWADQLSSRSDPPT